MVGKTVLQYQILERLGSGGMGEIFKAQDTKLNRTVAIKVLSQGVSTESDARRRFIQEAQAASSLNHPNIIVIHDIVSRGEDQFMVMEFVNGKTLADSIPPGGLNASVALHYAVQIADGLQAAHAVGIIHRDLKPGNLMITPQGLVKILDFGLAKLTTPADSVSLSAITQTVGPAPMTVQGSIVGTVNYMAPEQAQAGRVDARSDVFSFGCVLYEMLTGRRAFHGDAPMLTLTAILRDEPQPVLDLAPGTPPPLVEIIRRALRKDPSQRWQSMGEMHAELAQLKQRLDSGVLAAVPATPPSTSSWKRWAAILIAPVLLLAWWMGYRAIQPAKPPRTTVPATVPRPDAPPKPSALSPPILMNDAILDMAQNHVPDPVIIGHIHASHTNFNLSTAEIIRLTKGGVSADVIQAMRDPAGASATASSGAAAPTSPTPTVQDRTVPVVGGVPIEMTLAEDVRADCKPGQPLRFVVSRDITSGDTVVVAKGAVVSGIVVEAARKKFLVHTSRPTFRLLGVAAVDGSELKVRATTGRLGESRKDPPFEPVGGLRSKDAVVPAGSRFIGYFDGDQTITVHR
jgi:serine/threonine-protein kinase